MFNATFNNISVISWRSVLLVEETRVPSENRRPVTSHWQTLSHNVGSSTLSLIGTTIIFTSIPRQKTTDRWNIMDWFIINYPNEQIYIHTCVNISYYFFLCWKAAYTGLLLCRNEMMMCRILVHNDVGNKHFYVLISYCNQVFFSNYLINNCSCSGHSTHSLMSL